MQSRTRQLTETAMARDAAREKQAKLNIAIVVADWKDTEALLEGIQTELKRRGIALQAWDMGSDDWIVSIADRKITAKQFTAEMDGGHGPLDPEGDQPEATEVDL